MRTSLQQLAGQQGLGMPVDPVAAFEHYRGAADAGHVTAAACCAHMLFSGVGCLARCAAAAAAAAATAAAAVVAAAAAAAAANAVSLLLPPLARSAAGLAAP
jgi:TPR repeat protein